MPNLQNLFRAVIVLAIPTSFQNKVFVKENPRSGLDIKITQISSQDDVNSLINSLQQQLGKDLLIKEVSPDEMVLSTQDNEPIR